MIKSRLSPILSKGASRLSRIADAIGNRLSNQPPKILLYLNLPQDLDMLLPIAIRLKEGAKGEGLKRQELERQELERPRREKRRAKNANANSTNASSTNAKNTTAYTVEVVISDKAWQQSPRINTLLSAAGIAPQVISHKSAVAGLQPSLSNVCAVVTASESTANAHKGAYTLTQRANQQGLATYTMQHGYENVGITYFDEEYPVGRILFASQTIFTWVPLSDIPSETPAETRRKCVAVGCPKFIDAPGLKANVPGRQPNSPLVAVFENLHWGRYSDDYRQRFLHDLEQTAIAYPMVTFLVKPHHTGLWLTKRYQGTVPVADNLIIADPKDPQWEVFTAPALIEIADAVITTPSTVAIDAVRANKRVAVVAYEMNLANYAPLPRLRSGENWRSLIAPLSIHPLDTHTATPDKAAAASRTTEFAQAHLVPGDAVQKIVDQIVTDISV